jgi:UDP-N-acetylglucosamine 2-epimerase (non-hydrolysing)
MSKNLKICFVLGTRPEIIKLYSCIKYCQDNNIDHFLIHTNQHYNSNMDSIFFEELEILPSKYNLQVGSGTHAKMTAKMLTSIEDVIEKENPTVVVVQGDTNSTFAGALVATKMNIKVAHIEGGLRSYDRSMPEEINRIMVDHISDFIFAPTNSQFQTLIGEGIDQKKILVTGNTVVDAILIGKNLSEQKSNILDRLSLQRKLNTRLDSSDPSDIEEDLFGDISSSGLFSTNKNQVNDQRSEFFLLTCHRPSNTDKQENFENILRAINEICIEQNKICIFPAHPRLANQSNLIKAYENIKVIEPVSFLDMIALQLNAKMIFTDSGGIQEEACILEKKTIILRTNTERPETVEVGGAVLLNEITISEIKKQFMLLNKKQVNWKNPFGEGKSGQQIIQFLTNSVDKN